MSALAVKHGMNPPSRTGMRVNVWMANREPGLSHRARIRSTAGETERRVLCETVGLEHGPHRRAFDSKRLEARQPDQLMCSACHKAKTLRDIKAIWKTKRLNGRALSQYERRKKFGPKLRGRPFCSGQ